MKRFSVELIYRTSKRNVRMSVKTVEAETAEEGLEQGVHSSRVEPVAIEGLVVRLVGNQGEVAGV